MIDYFEGGLLSPGKCTFYIEITAPPSTEGMSAAERKKYGIEEIPISEYKKQAIWRFLPPELKEMLEKEKTVRIAHNFSVKITMRSTIPTDGTKRREGKNEWE